VGPQGQGGNLIVDATGKIVGNLYINAFPKNFYGDGLHAVLRQIGGIWVELPVLDLTSGFTTFDSLSYYYQSMDCTGQAYIYVNREYMQASAPAIATITTIPPATAPSIYYAGTPVMMTFNSSRAAGTTECSVSTVQYAYMGPVQSYPVSSLGLTPPFSLK
jgi:hypothetical protein